MMVLCHDCHKEIHNVNYTRAKDSLVVHTSPYYIPSLLV